MNYTPAQLREPLVRYPIYDCIFGSGDAASKQPRTLQTHIAFLFLDEFPEFGTRIMENKVVTISCTKGSLTFSANFQLIAAMNPFPYGYYGHSLKPCICAPVVVTKYQKRISGPLLDHIDIHIEAPRVDYEKLSGNKVSESSESIRQRVQVACERQRLRFLNNGSADIYAISWESHFF